MDAKHALLQFRNKEYPSIAKSYFITRLRKSLDFFNAYSEGAESDSFLADFKVVKSSKQLKERIQAAMKTLKRDAWGDIVQGLYVPNLPPPFTTKTLKPDVLTQRFPDLAALPRSHGSRRPNSSRGEVKVSTRT